MQMYLQIATSQEEHKQEKSDMKMIEKLATERALSVMSNALLEMLANLNVSEDIKFTLRKAFPKNLTQILVSLASLLYNPELVGTKYEIKKDNLLMEKVKADLVEILNIVTNILNQQLIELILVTLNDNRKISDVELVLEIILAYRPFFTEHTPFFQFIQTLKNDIIHLKMTIPKTEYKEMQSDFNAIDIIFDVPEYNVHNLKLLQSSLKQALMNADSLEKILHYLEKIHTQVGKNNMDKQKEALVSIKEKILKKIGKFEGITELELELQKHTIESIDNKDETFKKQYKNILQELNKVQSLEKQTKLITIAKEQLLMDLKVLAQKTSYITEEQIIEKNKLLNNVKKGTHKMEMSTKNGQQEKNQTPDFVYTAAKFGFTKQIEEAFKKKLSPNQLLVEDDKGYTPLYHALINKHKDTFDLMLDKIDEEKLKEHLKQTSDASRYKNTDDKFYAALFIAHEKRRNYAKDNENHKIAERYLQIMEQFEQNNCFETVSSNTNSENSKVFFVQAILSNFLNERLFSILKKTADINEPLDNNKNTALHLASLMGFESQVEMFLSASADVHAKNKNGHTPIHLASLYGHEQILHLLLSKENYSTSKDSDDMTPICLAASKGHENIVKILIEREKENTSKALECAISNDQLKIAQFLIKHKSCEIDKQSLKLSARSGSVNVFRYLFNQLESEDMSQLLHEAVRGGNIEIINLILENKNTVNINERDKFGDTAIHIAVRTKQSNIIKYLIRRQASVNIENKKNRTPINLAILKVNMSAFDLLLPLSNLEKPDKKMRTALHMAAKQGSEPMTTKLIEKLKENNATIDPVDKDGNTPLHLAIKYANEHIVRVLLENGADVKKCGENGSNILHLAAAYNNLTTFMYLIDHCTEINAKNKDDMTPLHVALQCRKEDIAKALLSIENCDVSGKDCRGLKPLHYAVAQNYTEIAKRILDKDKNLDDEICIAAYLGYKTMAKILIENGANVNAIYEHKPIKKPFIIRTSSSFVEGHANLEKCDNGNIRDRHVPMNDYSYCTPLYYAIIGNANEEIIKLLEDAGADENGVPPLHLPNKKGFLRDFKKLWQKK